MKKFGLPLPDLQVTFYNRLSELRDILLLDALFKVVGESNLEIINQELGALAPKEALRRVASWGLRGELVFPVPAILQARSHLLGYYRLLLGFSQKQFYSKHYGLGRFRSMEERGTLSDWQANHLEDLCRVLGESSAYLVNNVQRLDAQALHELTLLTLGPQFRGGALNLLGTEATEKVFDLIKTHVAVAVVSSTRLSLKIENAAGRIVQVEFASDPDICIREELASGNFRNLVAIEIKGGRDISNVHNRIGESEKSHQKARKEGFVECWPMVGVHRLDLDLAKRESPSTDRFFRIDAVVKPGTPDFKEFREHLLARIGLRD